MSFRQTLLTLFALALMPAAQAQCTYTLSMFEMLGESQTATATAALNGELSSVTFDLNFSGTGASYPADMMVYIGAPNGECVVWGGWNIPPTGSCTNIGTGFDNSWPGNWSTTLNGFYTHTLYTADYNLFGTGTWSVTIQNAWFGSAPVTYDLDIVFNGPCEGECTDEAACNYVAEPVLPNDDACLYALDLYPSGYYDCDGNCIGDFNGNGVCDNEEVFGCIYAESANFDSLATSDDGSCEPLCGLEADCDLVYDGDGDLIVATGDLLGLLSEFGESCN